MNNLYSSQLFSSTCPPCPSDNSLFFNLILGTSYENTKENCLIFLKNYSKQYFYQKRDIFKMIINELILNEISDKMISINESIYLINQLIKKYSKNNILNALYEFISEKEEIIQPIESKNNLNIANNFSSNKNGNNENNDTNSNDKEPKKVDNILFNNIKEKVEDINNELNNIKNSKFLEKKRKNCETSKINDESTQKNNKKLKFIIRKEDKKEERNIKEENFVKNEGQKNEKEDINENIYLNVEEEIIEEGQNEIKIQKDKKKNNKAKNEIIEQKIENKLKSMTINNIKNYFPLIPQNENNPNKTKANPKRCLLIEEMIKLDSNSNSNSNEIMMNNNSMTLKSISHSSTLSKKSKKIHEITNLKNHILI